MLKHVCEALPRTVLDAVGVLALTADLVAYEII